MAQQDDSIPGTGSGNVYLDSLIWGCGWDMTEGPIAVWFGEGAIPDIPGVVGLPWTQDEIDAFTAILGNYEAVCGLDFEIVDSYAEADMVEWKLEQSFFSPGVLASHEVPDETFAQTYGYYNSDASGWGNFDPGSDAYYTLMHELGHAVGLAHPHDGGGEGDGTIFPGVTDPFDTGDDELNQAIWTAMSYNRGWDDVPPPGDVAYGSASTLMAFDIATLQYLYGANMTYNTGDDTYVLPAVNAPGTGWSCIWDAGGVDTISNSGSALACSIDLNDAPLTGPNAGGFVSRALGVTGGFTIANGASIENAVGGSNDDTLIGNELANVLTGSGGNDTLNGGDGSDTLDGGDGSDTASYESAGGGVTVALSLAGAQNTGGAGIDTLSFIESLVGSGFADTLSGTSSANRLSGAGSDDTLTGFGGNDRLDGGIGADAMSGGHGDDTYVVDNTGDTASESSGTGADTVQSTVTFTLAGGIESLVLNGAAAINGTGNASVNAIAGNAAANQLSGLGQNDTLTGFGGNDRLDGGAGADTMAGGNGDDTYVVDNAGDTASEASGSGADTVQSVVSFTLGAGIETLVLNGAAAIDGAGNGGANTLYGNSAANRLDGNGGADTIRGFGGADVFVFDDGDGADTVTDFQNGSDTCDLTQVAGIDEFSDLVLTDTGAGVEVDYVTGSFELASVANFAAIDATDFVFA